LLNVPPSKSSSIPFVTRIMIPTQNQTNESLNACSNHTADFGRGHEKE
jgi:hypothetical protein